ncbi:MAG: TraR/DksA family transcriptional regulator [Gemmatimonadota bacterium]
MPLTDDQSKALREELAAEAARLERSLSIGAEATRPVELDQQAVGRLSRMDSLQSQHLSQGLQERQEARLGAIRSALKRMDAGTYGICAHCGADIDPGRLFVVLEAEECGGCTTP